MKRLILGICSVIAVFASVQIMKTSKNVKPMDLFEDNVEVLAQDEQPDVWWDCLFNTQVDCIALHPTDPDKDVVRPYVAWWR